MTKTPFNSPRDLAQPPYHLRNGLADRAEADRNEAEHRRRMGMRDQAYGVTDRERFDAWVKGHAIEFTERELSMCWLAWQAAQR